MNVLSAKPFAVVTTKASGVRVVWSRFDNKAEAEAEAAHLRRVVGPADVFEVAGRPGESVRADTPGRSRELGAVTDERA